MNETAEKLTIPADVARHVRETITPEEARYIADESQNVFLALDFEDADILYVMASRALDLGATDVDSFIIGYLAGRASMNAMPATAAAHETTRRTTSAAMHSSGGR